MKKFLAMVLALVMALSLVACGEQGGNQSGDNSGKKVIKIGVFEQNKVAVSHGQSANRYLRFRFVHMPSTSKIKVMIPVMTIIQTMAVTTACVVALPTLSALRPQ